MSLHGEISKDIYFVTGVVQAVKNCSLVCDCGRHGCNTLWEVAVDPRRVNEVANPEATFWLGSVCITKVGVENEAFREARNLNQNLTMEKYLRSYLQTDEEILAMYHEKFFPRGAPAWASLGGVIWGLRKKGTINRLIDYLKHPTNDHAWKLANALLEATTCEFNWTKPGGTWVDYMQDIANAKYTTNGKKFGSLPSSMLFARGKYESTPRRSRQSNEFYLSRYEQEEMARSSAAYEASLCESSREYRKHVAPIFHSKLIMCVVGDDKAMACCQGKTLTETWKKTHAFLSTEYLHILGCKDPACVHDRNPNMKRREELFAALNMAAHSPPAGMPALPFPVKQKGPEV